MANKTVSQLEDSVSGILQGLNLNNVSSLFTVFERTVRETSVLIDIPEAVSHNNFTLYDGVVDYALPTDIFATGIRDIRPQGVARFPGDTVEKQYSDLFDREKSYITSGYKTTVDFNKGSGVLRVVSRFPQPRVELDPMTATTGWALDGVVATGLTTDETIYWQQPASLLFQLGTGTGTLTKTVPSADLSSNGYLTQGSVFLAIYGASLANLTSITLRLGSSASNYYSVSATTGFVKAFTGGEYMLVQFDLSTATTTGTPVQTAIDYVQLSFITSGAVANMHTGDIWIALPCPTTLLYTTPAIFQPANSTSVNATITNQQDTILLNAAAYAIYELMCAINIAIDQGGTLASGVIQTLQQKLNGVRGYRGVLIQPGLLDLYRADNPSQELRTGGSYYEGIYG